MEVVSNNSNSTSISNNNNNEKTELFHGIEYATKVEAHSGKLYASNNTDGKGATFTIILPLINKEQKQK
jgi:signal transduction histidine kinase